ncbi:hypothetical protein GCK32_013563 [Trichostrongylus colubriformis]|uniref:7TM GPCR serpentine receptor class x (Srx) domain-containing protein n=1 Tax=Trichostrongylus colubriformis TaxID=6319 RepID=A0AAN8EVU1_TRICO
MSNSAANLEEDAAAIRDRHIAALAIFMECGRMSWYVDFSQDLIIVILIAIIDTVTILKFRLTSAQIDKGNSRMAASKRSMEKNFLRQVVLQDVLFAIGLGSYFFFAWFFENKWVIWSLSTLAWCFLHLSDAIITITFNKEFRRLICSCMSCHSCEQI